MASKTYYKQDEETIKDFLKSFHEQDGLIGGNARYLSTSNDDTAIYCLSDDKRTTSLLETGIDPDFILERLRYWAGVLLTGSYPEFDNVKTAINDNQ